MSRIQRLLVLALAVFFVFGTVSPAVATEEHGGDDTEQVEETTTTAPWEGEGPAVIIPEAGEETEDQPWTSRFIYPTIVVGTLALIAGLAIGYNRSIRRKYKVTS